MKLVLQIAAAIVLASVFLSLLWLALMNGAGGMAMFAFVASIVALVAYIFINSPKWEKEL